MTAQDVINWVDGKKHNVCSQEDKLFWLSQVEKMAAQLLARCGLEPGETVVEPETVLSVPAPYDGLYLRWLEAQIDYTNQEYLKYNNAMALFTALWQEYANQVRRGAPAVGRRNFF
ncbi:MAG: hypothetical protein ACI3XG_09540 [Faecousia sp.]